MTGSPIPLLVVEGGHRAVGRQLGEACAASLRRAADLESGGTGRGGISLDEVLRRAAGYREATRRHLPWLLEELDGAAEGAGVDRQHLFAASVEELWDRPLAQLACGSSTKEAVARREAAGRCTDLLVDRGGTSTGHLLVAHNNDLPSSSEEDVVAVEWRLPGDPVVFTLGIGCWISVGWNSAGLSLSGNEVSPNDERVGIPRLLLVRAQLRARSIDEARGLCLHPARASAYNTVLAHVTGGCVDVEASATSWQLSGPDERRAIVHTNHYVSDEMAPYEQDPEQLSNSVARFDRARALLAELRPEETDLSALRAILSDHFQAPDSICRHAADGRGTKTVFWCAADVTDRLVVYGRGNPCDSVSQTYRFARSS